MIRIFGHQLYFSFEHYVYNFEVSQEIETVGLYCEKITKENIRKADMGYFSIDMLWKVLKKNATNSEGFLFREKHNDRVIGFVILAYRGAKEIHYKINNADAYIVAIGVFPDYRGKGYSQRILAHINNLCFSRGQRILKLVVDSNNVAAIKSYEKFGFVRDGTRRFKRFAGIDLLLHKKI